MDLRSFLHSAIHAAYCFTQSACTVEVLSCNNDMMTMLYQGGSCVSCMWLLLGILSVLMYALPRSHGMQFMPRFLA